MSSHLHEIATYRVRRALGFEVDVILAEPFDCGSALGVAVVLGDRCHAAKTQIIECDLTKAADEAAIALNDWHGQ